MRSSFFLFASCLLSCVVALLPPAALAIQQTHWVAPDGIDTPACTAMAPCRTINHVLQSVVSDGDVINVQPGIYREQIDIVHDNLTLQGTAPGVFLYGAVKPDLLPAEGKYTAPWAWGEFFNGTPFCENLTNDVGLADVQCNTLGFWEDGQRLRQVFAKSSVVAGTFYFDTTTDAVWLQPYAGSDGLAAIEGASHPHVLKLSSGSSGVTVKDLNIWYGASMPDDGILQVEGSGHLVENVDVRYTAGGGILVYGADGVTMREVEAAQHGQNGWRIRANASFSTTSGWQINDWVDDLVLDHAISRGNGWKGYDNCWGGGGTKFSFTRDMQIDGFYSADNNGFGIWLDIENHAYNVTESLSARDAGRGIFVEYISDDGSVENNVVFNTQDADDIGCGISVGLAAADSRNVTIKNNTVYSTADDVKGLMLKTGCATCRSFPYASENIAWENNLLINKGDAGFVRDLDAGTNTTFSYSNMVVEESFAGDATVAVCWDGMGNCTQAAFDIQVLTPGTYLDDETDECGFTATSTAIDGAGALGFVHPMYEAICDDTPPASPPVAGFSFAADNLLVTFTDTSTDEEGLVAWAWDFGDGGTSTVQHPQYTYPAAGTYPVSLTVTNTNGLTDSFSSDITVDAPPAPAEPPMAAFTFTATGLSVQFADLSTDDEAVTSWLWMFDDGNQSVAQHPVHTYSEAGSYNVTLLVEDNEGLTASTTQEVTVEVPDQPLPPAPAFSYTTEGLTVTFQDMSTDDGMIVAWAWDFGDGEEAGIANPVHVYSEAGTYAVQLTVTDEAGLSASVTEDVEVVMTPVEIPPVAAFTFSIDGLQVQFYDSSTDEDGQITGWSWDFGDGETATLQNPVHTFVTAGAYYVTLEVTDNAGLRADTGVQLLVAEDDDSAAGMYVEVEGLVVMEAEHFVSRTTNNTTGDTWTAQQVILNGTPADAVQALPDDGHTVTDNVLDGNASLQFPVLFLNTGAYYVWVRMRPDVNASTVYAGTFEDASLIGETKFDAPSGDWVWYNRKNQGRRARMQVSATGEQIVQLWMREDGVAIDRLLLTTDPDFVPAGVGPGESPRVLIDPFAASDGFRTPQLNLEAAELVVGQFYPNPASVASSLLLDVPADARVIVSYIDMVGRMQLQQHYDLSAGPGQKLGVDTSQWPAGIYLARVRILMAEGIQTFSRRLVVVPAGAP